MLRIKRKAKEAIDPDWLQTVKELKEIAIKMRGAAFERLPWLDLRELEGSEEDPAVLLITALGEPRSFQTEKMRRPLHVVDAEVELSSDPKIETGKYSIMLNTSVLKSEFERVKQEMGSITGEKFIIAYYGRVKTKSSPQPVYIFRVIPHSE